MTSPTKRSAFKSAVAGPMSGNNTKVNNENDEPNTKDTDKGTTRPPPLVDIPTRQSPIGLSPFHPHIDSSLQS